MKKNLFAVAFALIGFLAQANTSTSHSSDVLELKESIRMETSTYSCFDFYDSCDGSWEVCHHGYIDEIADFLFDWDGFC